MSSQNLVVIPTYNERENIEKIIHAVMALPTSFHVLVVDDNSPDGTANIVKQLQLQYPENIHLEVRHQKSGLGTAYVHGFLWALKQNQYHFIFEMDADFSHNPNDLEKLLVACQNGADVAIGSRYVTGVNVVNWPLHRVLLSYFASIYVSWVTGMKIHDATAGFICYKKESLQRIALHKIRFVGYAFQIEMKYRAYVKKMKIEEVPIIFTDRTEGVSKMSNAIIKEAIWGVISLRIRQLLNRLN